MEESVKISKEDAVKALQSEQEERRQRCGQKIQEILDEEGCAIVPVVTIVGKEVISRVDIQVVK